MILAVGGGLITVEFALLEVVKIVEDEVDDQRLRIVCIAKWGFSPRLKPRMRTAIKSRVKQMMGNNIQPNQSHIQGSHVCIRMGRQE